MNTPRSAPSISTMGASSYLLRLPTELTEKICDVLGKENIKSLNLT